MKGRSQRYQERRAAGGPYHGPYEVAASPWDGKPIAVADLPTMSKFRWIGAAGANRPTTSASKWRNEDAREE